MIGLAVNPAAIFDALVLGGSAVLFVVFVRYFL